MSIFYCKISFGDELASEINLESEKICIHNIHCSGIGRVKFGSNLEAL